MRVLWRLFRNKVFLIRRCLLDDSKTCNAFDDFQDSTPNCFRSHNFIRQSNLKCLAISPVSPRWVDVILLYFIFFIVWDGLCFQEQVQCFSKHTDCHSSFGTGSSDTNSSQFPRKLTACAQNMWEVWSCKALLEKINFTPDTYIIQSQASLEIV